MSGKEFISPIAIDLGAKNTGVYFAHYEAGSSLDALQKEGAKEGKVYQLEKGSYTLLMVNRTAKRHQRRCFNRRQMAKRLFKLIWCEKFRLPWDKDVQQTISFLMNRRGFSFLTEEYDAEVLSRFPQEAYELLPEELKISSNEDGEYDFASALTEWANKGKETVKERFDAINEEPTRIDKELVFIARTRKLKDYCETRKNNQEIKEEKAEAKVKLSQLSKWIWDEWRQKGVKQLDETFVAEDKSDGSEITWKYLSSSGSVISFDLVTYLNQQTPEVAGKILDSLPDISEEEKNLKGSIWNFKKKFELGDKDFMPPEPLEGKAIFAWKQLHLQHLSFALYKILNELQSGGRHRSKYFEEVKKILENKHHSHRYLKTFCKKLQAGDFAPSDVEKLKNLIGHLSNLELKPLRKYFNDKRHRNGDHWSEDRLSELFGHWILHEWRVSPEKDKDKAEGKEGSYKSLCEKWGKGCKGTVIDFWLKTDPISTVPPYQDNNNRRPPRCQSLILNPIFLDNKYPEWRDWSGKLKELASVKEYLGGFEEDLKSLESGKKNSYFSNDETGKLKKDSGRRTSKDLDARVLQFILDRVKASDGLNLNEMYSHAKKYRQPQSTPQEKEKAKEQLEKAINDSILPDELKTKRDYKDEGIFADSAFLHLICKYYKLRQRARDGRIYIHPEYRFVKGRGYENTGRFDDKNHLLTYCNHKPRQKRYQMLGDLAGLLQVSPDKLEQIADKQDGETIDEKLFSWLNSIQSLKANCDRAAKEQKERRGRLRLDIQNIFGLIYHKKGSESSSEGEIKKILKSSRVNEASKLHNFCKRARKLCLDITKSLYDGSEQKRWEESLERNPAVAVYLLAQINNIAFKERSGNANTCAVCSTDNAQRMQTVESKDGKENYAKAQRLPAIETRLIDGAVMRMARIVGGAIAKDKWKKIKAELEAGKHVRVPIITESNRFEFEPNLREIKNKSKREDKNLPALADEIFKDKDERIKEASKGICPYTGEPLSGGDKDHIIPRSSEWGTLNDEANFIWASDRGNKEIKGDQEFSLADLNRGYKEKQFGTSDDQKIKSWIIEQIGNDESEDFEFGKYRGFINLLTEDQKKAFRHALFLVGHPLREKVINAIDSRTRTFVNGTQRYFAETLVNNLYKKALRLNHKLKRAGKKPLDLKKLNFDYFGVETQSNSRGSGIRDLRDEYEKISSEIEGYKKEEGKSQESYSHLIDAQLAFAIVAHDHRNDGGLKLEIDDSINLWPVETDTGEILEKTIFDVVRVKPEDTRKNNLERANPHQTFFVHRSIHRDSIYAEHYLPILVHKETSEVRIGFNWGNSYEFKDNTLNRTRLYFILKFNLQGIDLRRLIRDEPFSELKKHLANTSFISKTNYFYIPFNVQAIHAYYIGHYNTAKGHQSYSDEMEFLRSLAYRTEKKKITTLEETKKILHKGTYFQIPKNLTLPVRNEWQRLVHEWEKTNLEDGAFLRRFFREPESKQNHEKVRKVFSLPIKTGEGKFLLKRNSWNGEDIFQIVNDSDSREVNVKVFIPVFIKSKCCIGKLLSESAKSEKLFLLKEEDYYDQINDDIAIIKPRAWHSIELDDELRGWGIGNLEYCIDNNTRPKVRLTFNNRSEENKIDDILRHALLKPKEKERLKERLQKVAEEGGIIEYIGSGFPEIIQKKLFPVLAEYYQ